MLDQFELKEVDVWREGSQQVQNVVAVIVVEDFLGFKDSECLEMTHDCAEFGLRHQRWSRRELRGGLEPGALTE